MRVQRRIVKLGRRPKGTGTSREDILSAAQTEFGNRGFDRSSIRAVARRARVNPALVYHYFGNKDGLFRESVRHMMRPPRIDSTVLDPGSSDIGKLVVRMFLDRWSGGQDSMAFRGLLRSASTSEKAATILRELIIQQVTPYAALGRSDRDAERRVALIASALMGAGLVRFVVRLPGLAVPSTRQVAEWIGPSLTRYLRDPLSK